METEPNMVLRIAPEWRSYEDYSGRPDAKYRRNAREQIKKLAAAGCTIQPLTDLQPHAAGCTNYIYPFTTMRRSPGDMPENICRPWPGNEQQFPLQRDWRDNTLLGFVTSIRDGDTALGLLQLDLIARGWRGLPIYLRIVCTHRRPRHRLAL